MKTDTAIMSAYEQTTWQQQIVYVSAIMTGHIVDDVKAGPMVQRRRCDEVESAMRRSCIGGVMRLYRRSDGVVSMSCIAGVKATA